MISHRFRILALPSAIALLAKRGAWFRSTTAASASPTPWSDFPVGLKFDRVAGSMPMDLSKASKLAMFRVTYQPGTSWNLNIPYPILVAIESGSLHLHLEVDPIIVSRPVSVSGKPGETTKATEYRPTNFPVTLTVGDAFSSQTGNVGATSNDGDVPAQLLVAGAVIQPPLTEEVTSSTSGTPAATREP
jgi:hypothetical protein